MTRGDGSVLSYSYDPVSRASQLADNLAGTAYDQTLGFGYNPASQISSNTRSNDAYAWTGHYNLNRGYTANGLNQYTASGTVTPPTIRKATSPPRDCDLCLQFREFADLSERRNRARLRPGDAALPDFRRDTGDNPFRL